MRLYPSRVDAAKSLNVSEVRYAANNIPSVPGNAFATLTLRSSAASSAKNSPVPNSAFRRVPVLRWYAYHRPLA